MKYTITMTLALFLLIFMSNETQAQSSNPLAVWANFSADRGGEGGGEGGTGLAGGSGGGEQLIGIHHDWPRRGNVLNKSYSISWTSKSTAAHKVEIAEETLLNEGKILFHAMAKGNEMVIPLQYLNLDSSKEYFIRISQGEQKSEKALFKIADQKKYSDALKAAKANEKYNSASEFEKLLLESWALGDADFRKDGADHLKDTTKGVKYMLKEYNKKFK